MIAALQTFVTSYPVLSAILIAILVVTVILLAVSVVCLRQLPNDTLSEVLAPVAASDDLDTGFRPSASQPLPWNRAGGNWWPIP